MTRLPPLPRLLPPPGRQRRHLPPAPRAIPAPHPPPRPPRRVRVCPDNPVNSPPDPSHPPPTAYFIHAPLPRPPPPRRPLLPPHRALRRGRRHRLRHRLRTPPPPHPPRLQTAQPPINTDAHRYAPPPPPSRLPTSCFLLPTCPAFSVAPCLRGDRPQSPPDLPARREKLPATCKKLPATCEKSSATCEKLPATCEKSSATCEKSSAAQQKSPLTRETAVPARYRPLSPDPSIGRGLAAKTRHHREAAGRVNHADTESGSDGANKRRG